MTISLFSYSKVWLCPPGWDAYKEAIMNWVFVLGVVGQKPRFRRLPSGTAIASLLIITEEFFLSATGEKELRPEYHYVEVYGNQAELCPYYLRAGSVAMVEGRLGTFKRVDSKGIEYFTTVIMTSRIQPIDDTSSQTLKWAVMPPSVLSLAKGNIQKSKTEQIMQ